MKQFLQELIHLIRGPIFAILTVLGAGAIARQIFIEREHILAYLNACLGLIFNYPTFSAILIISICCSVYLIMETDLPNKIGLWVANGLLALMFLNGCYTAYTITIIILTTPALTPQFRL